MRPFLPVPFAEHDVFLPMITLEELDGTKRHVGSGAQRPSGQPFLDELVRDADDIDAGISLKPPATRPPPAGCCCKPRAGWPIAGPACRWARRITRFWALSWPCTWPARAPGDFGVQRHQYAHQGRRAGPGGGRLFQRSKCWKTRRSAKHRATRSTKASGKNGKTSNVPAKAAKHLEPRTARGPQLRQPLAGTKSSGKAAKRRFPPRCHWRFSLQNHHAVKPSATQPQQARMGVTARNREQNFA